MFFNIICLNYLNVQKVNAYIYYIDIDIFVTKTLKIMFISQKNVSFISTFGKFIIFDEFIRKEKC